MDRLPSPVLLGFPCGPAGKESALNAGYLGLIPGLGRSPGEGKGYPLQYSGLENSVDSVVHGVAESQKTEWLSLSLLYSILHRMAPNLNFISSSFFYDLKHQVDISKNQKCFSLQEEI